MNYVLSTMNCTAIVFSALLLLSCGGKRSETVAADAAASSDEDVRQEVVGLIHDLYAAAARNEGDIDSRFACREWCEMVKSVEAKDAGLQEIGFFNDDYWTEMQDSNPDDLEAHDFKFEQLDAEEGVQLAVDFILDSSVQTVHLRFSLCRDDGQWRVHDITRFFVDEGGKEDSYSMMESMRDYLNEPDEEASDLSFASLAGVYDSLGEDGSSESRFCLNDDGTATWNMIGSLHFTEYTYSIERNVICLKVKGLDTEEECYVYDSDARALKNEQGAVYYRQVDGL